MNFSVGSCWCRWLQWFLTVVELMAGPTRTLNCTASQMIPPEREEWLGVWLPAFFFVCVCIYFHQLSDELDEHKE